MNLFHILFNFLIHSIIIVNCLKFTNDKNHVNENKISDLFKDRIPRRQLQINDADKAVGNKSILMVCIEFKNTKFTSSDRDNCVDNAKTKSRIALDNLTFQSYNKLHFNLEVRPNIYTSDNDFPLTYDNNGEWIYDVSDMADVVGNILSSTDNIDVADYDHLGMVFPYRPQIGFGGRAIISGEYSIYNGLKNTDELVITHEIGHNLGLLHATTNTNNHGYGNTLDIMGKGGWDHIPDFRKAHFNLANKHSLYWVKDTELVHLHPYGDHINCQGCVNSGVFKITSYDTIQDNLDDDIYLGLQWNEFSCSYYYFLINYGNPSPFLAPNQNYMYAGVRSLQQYSSLTTDVSKRLLRSLKSNSKPEKEDHVGGLEFTLGGTGTSNMGTEYNDLTPDTQDLLDGVLQKGQNTVIPMESFICKESVSVEVLDVEFIRGGTTETGGYQDITQLTVKAYFINQDTDHDVDGHGCYFTADDSSNCIHDNSQLTGIYSSTVTKTTFVNKYQNTLMPVEVTVKNADQSVLNGEYILSGTYETSTGNDSPVYTRDINGMDVYIAHYSERRDSSKGEWLLLNDLDNPDFRFAILGGEFKLPKSDQSYGGWREYNVDSGLFDGGKGFEVHVDDSITLPTSIQRDHDITLPIDQLYPEYSKGSFDVKGSGMNQGFSIFGIDINDINSGSDMNDDSICNDASLTKVQISSSNPSINGNKSRATFKAKYDANMSVDSSYRLCAQFSEYIKINIGTLKFEFSTYNANGCYIDENDASSCSSGTSEPLPLYSSTSTSTIFSNALQGIGTPSQITILDSTQSLLNGEYILSGTYETSIWYTSPVYTRDINGMNVYIALYIDRRDGRGEWLLLNDLEDPDNRFAATDDIISHSGNTKWIQYDETKDSFDKEFHSKMGSVLTLPGSIQRDQEFMINMKAYDEGVSSYLRIEGTDLTSDMSIFGRWSSGVIESSMNDDSLCADQNLEKFDVNPDPYIYAQGTIAEFEVPYNDMMCPKSEQANFILCANVEPGILLNIGSFSCEYLTNDPNTTTTPAPPKPSKKPKRKKKTKKKRKKSNKRK